MSSVIEPAEQGGMSWQKGALAIALLLGYQLLLHWALSHDPGLGLALTIAPIVLGLAWYLGRTPFVRVAILLVLGVGGWFVWRGAEANVSSIYLWPQVGAYLFMLWFFGHTLLPGRQALITRIARRVHGDLPVEIERYTRAVTWAWSIFFVGMAGISVGLFNFASLATWSIFANLLNLPLIAAMFLAEYLYRRLRYPDFPHASLAATIRTFRQFGEPRRDAGP